MKKYLSLLVLAGSIGSGYVGLAQGPGSMLGLSLNVNGQLAITSESPIGCPTLVCTTNMTTNVFCYTNCYWKRTCETNPATGQLQCTNTLVCAPRCFTNEFPKIHCTNEFVTPPPRVALRETLTGPVTANPPCDEVSALLPGNLVFQANLYADLRTNDWRGSHLGSFTITDGTNVVARGSLTGTDGVNSHRIGAATSSVAAGPLGCAACNHFEGSLRGVIAQTGPLYGATLLATYAGDLPAVPCPSPGAPEGLVILAIDGVVVIPCHREFSPFPGLNTDPGAVTAE